jgi:N-acetyl-beta-hexosaminidase
MNVMDPAVHAFVHDLYAEVVELFPDPWIHIGGDEGASVEL